MAKAKGKAKGKKALGSININGNYKIRFAGFARGTGARPYNVTGVGYLTLSGSKDLAGRQWTSRMPLDGVNDQFASSEWELSGSYAIDPTDGTVLAAIQFTPEGGTAPVMQDVFRMVPNDSASDAFWFISTAPQDETGKRLDELVSGDAVKVI
jgi:hypothetical protein